MTQPDAIGAAVAHTLTRLRGDQKLMALVGGRIAEGTVRQNPKPTYPLVLVQVYGDSETQVYNGGTIAFEQVEMLVRIVAVAENMGALRAAASRIVAALHDTHGTYDDGEVASCHKTGGASMTENEGDLTYRYLGSRYTLMVA